MLIRRPRTVLSVLFHIQTSSSPSSSLPSSLNKWILVFNIYWKTVLLQNNPLFAIRMIKYCSFFTISTVLCSENPACWISVALKSFNCLKSFQLKVYWSVESLVVSGSFGLKGISAHLLKTGLFTFLMLADV